MKKKNAIIEVLKMTFGEMKGEIWAIIRPLVFAGAVVGGTYAASIILDRLQPHTSFGPMNNFALFMFIFLVSFGISVRIKSKEIEELKKEIKKLEDGE